MWCSRRPGENGARNDSEDEPGFDIPTLINGVLTHGSNGPSMQGQPWGISSSLFLSSL